MADGGVKARLRGQQSGIRMSTGSVRKRTCRLVTYFTESDRQGDGVSIPSVHANMCL